MLNPRYVERIATIAGKIKRSEHLYIIGKSWHYPMALESAIKIQEVSYVHAEGFAGSELKHGNYCAHRTRHALHRAGQC